MRLLVSFAMALGLSCCDSGDVNSDGKSSWLRACRGDVDCPAAATCQCGICTKGCAGSEQCAGVPVTSACIEVSSVQSGGRCKVGASASGVCLPGCGADADCNSRGLECVAGVCLPLVAEERDAGGADMGRKPGAPRADGGESLGAGGAASGSGLDATAGRASTDGALPPLRGSPSDAPSNAYGGPVAFDSGFIGADCGGISYWRDDVPCLYFNYCLPSCEKDADCPAPESGTAVPTCRMLDSTDVSPPGASPGAIACALSCEHGEQCPIGMVCDAETNGVASGFHKCVWTQDSIEKGCPAHCRLDPIPRDCANFCAAVGVACDPTKGVSCCSGLECGAEHFCVTKG
jgi:hypothetical protein